MLDSPGAPEVTCEKAEHHRRELLDGFWKSKGVENAVASANAGPMD